MVHQQWRSILHYPINLIYLESSNQLLIHWVCLSKDCNAQDNKLCKKKKIIMRKNLTVMQNNMISMSFGGILDSLTIAGICYWFHDAILTVQTALGEIPSATSWMIKRMYCSTKVSHWKTQHEMLQNGNCSKIYLTHWSLWQIPQILMSFLKIISLTQYVWMFTLAIILAKLTFLSSSLTMNRHLSIWPAYDTIWVTRPPWVNSLWSGVAIWLWRSYLHTGLAPSHYLNQSWVIVDWSLTNFGEIWIKIKIWTLMATSGTTILVPYL